MKIILIYFAIKYKGDWDKIYKALEDKEKVALEEIMKLEKKIEKEKWKLITILDADYPKAFRSAYKPPFVAWTKGDIKALDKKALTLVSENIDAVALKNINEHTPEASKSFNLVTTVAEHKEEISKFYKSKVVLADCGIDKVGVKLNKGDLLISEFPEGRIATKQTTRSTNRLIPSMSEALVIFNKNKTTSTLDNLVSNFLNYGKEISCFPGDGSENDGNSKLIQQGASLITKIKDISK